MRYSIDALQNVGGIKYNEKNCMLWWLKKMIIYVCGDFRSNW